MDDLLCGTCHTAPCRLSHICPHDAVSIKKKEKKREMNRRPGGWERLTVEELEADIRFDDELAADAQLDTLLVPSGRVLGRAVQAANEQMLKPEDLNPEPRYILISCNKRGFIVEKIFGTGLQALKDHQLAYCCDPKCIDPNPSPGHEVLTRGRYLGMATPYPDPYNWGMWIINLTLRHQACKTRVSTPGRDPVNEIRLFLLVNHRHDQLDDGENWLSPEMSLLIQRYIATPNVDLFRFAGRFESRTIVKHRDTGQ